MNTESHKTMELQAFIALLDAMGSNRTAWPAEMRGEAEQLLARSALARAELQAAQALDEFVAAAPKHVAPPGLHARILAGLPPETSKTFDQLVSWLTAAFWRPAAFALAPLLFGIWLGSAVPVQEESSPALDLSSVLLDEVYENYD
jgi:hypothetical protein